MSLSDAVESILMQAEKKQRLIVAWSNHELNVIERDCPEHLERFKARYVNARTLIVHWRNARHGGDKPDKNTLSAYLAFLGYPVPAGAGRPGGQDDQVVAGRLSQGSSCGPADREPARPMGSAHRPQRPRLRRHAPDLRQGRRRDGSFQGGRVSENRDIAEDNEVVGYTSEGYPLNAAGSIVLTPEIVAVRVPPWRERNIEAESQSPRRHASWASCVLVYRLDIIRRFRR